MKHLLFLFTTCLLTASAQAQNVGIGTPTPDASALLHVDLGSSTTKGLLITGSYNGASTVPNLGAGSRLMFYPGKAAFRAGYTDGAYWDNINVGNFSTAMGTNTIASGDFSTAIGFVTTASAYSSIAIGSGGQANSVYSVAIGESVTANSWNSISLGRQNDPIVSSPTIGWTLNEPLLIVGNGTGPSDKKNAFAIAKNGNIYIDASNKNDGTLSGNTLLFGTFNGTAEGIASKRTATGNQYGLDFYTASFNRMSITNGGNIGIGTLTPGEKLTIVSADNNSGTNISAFYPNNLTQGIGIGYDEIRKLGTTANSNLFINAKGSGNLILENSATGNVGIGTTSPGAKLQVTAGDESFALFGPNASYGAMLYVGASPTNHSAALTAQVFVSDGNLHVDPAAGKNIYIGYFQARDIYLDPNGGNVGIGTTNPQKNLSVQNGMNVDQADGNTGSVVNAISFGNNSGEGIGSKRNAGSNQWGLDFYTGAINRMSITNSGKVGIGTTSPATTLEVNGYSKLGTDAPSIKVKKFTGTTAASQGAGVLITHGMNSSKFISITVMVEYSPGYWVGPNDIVPAGPGDNFIWDVSPTYIEVWNSAGSSISILSKPFVILITYEE